MCIRPPRGPYFDVILRLGVGIAKPLRSILKFCGNVPGAIIADLLSHVLYISDAGLFKSINDEELLNLIDFRSDNFRSEGARLARRSCAEALIVIVATVANASILFNNFIII